jgi:dTDP-glucose pyrophosphorylase
LSGVPIIPTFNHSKIQNIVQNDPEGYARALSSPDAEKYVDGEDEVVDFETIINEVEPACTNG